MAPEVADRIRGYLRDGRLTLEDGGLTDAHLEADAVVNCTGPLTDLDRTTDPLLQALRSRGLVAPDPLRLGLDSTLDGEVVGSDGRVVPGLYAVGPPRKGTLWESTAIPEIRTQAAEVARLVLGRVTAANV
jgi:uncharacterized NAD(P)/FAD-binding protein YdhS